MNLIVDPLTHPICMIQHLIGSYGENIVFRFSRYQHVPQSLEDNRETFEVSATDVSSNWLQAQLADLEFGEELAINSTVMIDGVTWHIPMIDFASKNLEKIEVNIAKLGHRIPGALILFDSGSSFHAYGTTLICEGGWRGFMGNVLLCNTGNESNVVDQRWVGHRLIAGYGALRWSCNTKNYSRLPELVNKEKTGADPK